MKENDNNENILMCEISNEYEGEEMAINQCNEN